jgi:TolB protein
MAPRRALALALALALTLLPGAAVSAPSRSDGATRIPITGLKGSLQNACYSPNGKRLAITQWLAGYNGGERADVHVVSVEGGPSLALVSHNDTISVNLPGSCWERGRIVYSADIGPDEVFSVKPDGSDRKRVTRRGRFAAFEPSLSPDGKWVVFESHVYDAETPGELWKIRTDGTGLKRLVTGSDDRQPNWSPAGDVIVFQRFRNNQWDLWTMDTDGDGLRNITRTPNLNETDVSWSPSGDWLVYSGDGPNVDIASLYTIRFDGAAKKRLTTARGFYDGAPAWSPNGRTIAFESRRGEPDGSPGTTIWVIAAPPGRK